MLQALVACRLTEQSRFVVVLVGTMWLLVEKYSIGICVCIQGQHYLQLLDDNMYQG